jgi:hypothetical protein
VFLIVVNCSGFARVLYKIDYCYIPKDGCPPIMLALSGRMNERPTCETEFAQLQQNHMGDSRVKQNKKQNRSRKRKTKAKAEFR